MNKIKLGDYIDIITDYHANGAYEKLKENIQLKYHEDYAIMIRTLNFESNDFSKNLIYLNEKEYNYLSKSKVYENDIIMNKIANAGSVYLMPKLNKPVSLAMNLFLIRFNQYIDSKFIFYLMKLNEPYIKKFAKGTTTKTITKDAVRDLEFNIPSLPTQQKIASVLSALDNKIEINNKINAELEAMAKNLYDYWFVQFDFPNENGKPYKSSGGKMVFNETLKREIPEGWEVKKLDKMIDFTRGVSYTSKTVNDKEGIPMINLKSFNLNGTYRYDGIKYFTGKLNDSRILDKGDLLIAITDVTREAEIIGRAIINPDFNKQSVCSCDVARVDIVSEDLKKNYLRYLFNSNSYHNYIKHFASGTLVLHLDLQGVKWFTHAIPSSRVQNDFEKFINSIDEKITLNLKQNQELSQLSDWLLPMLMNGQVTVDDAKDEVLGMVAEPSVDYKTSNLTDKDKKVRRKMLATYIINQSLDDTSFGKTKFEKLLHLVEFHIIKGDYNQKYSVQAAGPYDGGFTKVFWSEVTKSKWFEIKELGKLKRILPSDNHSKSLVDYGYLSDDLKELINDFISKFKNSNYEQPEIVSTLFAVWNNRIIRNEMITDALLKKDFLEWDEQKVRYQNRLDDALTWMKNSNIVPTGWGKEIKRIKK